VRGDGAVLLAMGSSAPEGPAQPPRFTEPPLREVA
jgi:hypothetical protein